MGHALNNTLQDVLVRWRRMQGYNALWMPGTDHAGIATQAVVERLIFQQEKKTRYDLDPEPAKSREKLVARIWEWKDRENIFRINDYAIGALGGRSHVLRFQWLAKMGKSLGAFPADRCFFQRVGRAPQ